jgi:RHS repeat-associated protein
MGDPFSSKEIHPNSGMYYYGHRFYDPSLQRWTNWDPIADKGGINLFAFVNSNPVSGIDPSGELGLSYCACWKSGVCEETCLCVDLLTIPPTPSVLKVPLPWWSCILRNLCPISPVGFPIPE